MTMENSPDLTAYLLDELPPEEHSAVELALAASPDLRAELESIRKTHAVIGAHLDRETGPEPVVAKPVSFRVNPKVSSFRRTLVFLGTPGGFGALAACVTLAAVIAITRDTAPKAVLRAELSETKTVATVADPERFEVKKTKDEAEFRARIARERLSYSEPAQVILKTDRLPAGPGPAPSPSFASGLTAGGLSKGSGGGTGGGEGTGVGIGKGGGRSYNSLYGAKSAPSTTGAIGGLSVKATVDFESNYIFRGKEHSDANVQMKADSACKFPGAGTPSIYDGSLRPPGSEEVLDKNAFPGARDRFDAGVTEQAYLKAAEAPLSTFSVDVNTASYAYARKLFADGIKPHPEAIRAEEWLNNFAYAYPAPAGAHPVSVYTEGSDCPWNAEHKLVRIGLRAKSVSQENRPPVNLVFLIDTSGSMMSQDRLPLAKESLLKLLERLDERDRVGIVTYAGNSGVAAEPTRCDAAGKSKLGSVINGLESGGSTNGAAGLREAYALAARHLNADGVNRVVLATDGDFNVGLSGTSEIVALAKREAGKKVFLTVLGFGTGNLNADLMKQLSVKADGNHYFIDSLKEADRVLSQKLAGTLVTVARDVKIQIDFNPARVAAYRLIGYDTRRLANEDFNDDTKDAGEMGAGHTVTALYEIIPVGATPPVDDSRYVATKPAAEKPSAPVSDEWLTAKVRYQPPQGGKSTLLETPLPASGMKPLAEASPDQQFAAAVAEAALFFRDSAHKGSANIDDAIRLLARPGVTGDDADRKEFADMLRMARHLGK